MVEMPYRIAILRWLEFAEQTRRMAEAMHDSQARQTMLMIAARYEEMAQRMEAHARTNLPAGSGESG